MNIHHAYLTSTLLRIASVVFFSVVHIGCGTKERVDVSEPVANHGSDDLFFQDNEISHSKTITKNLAGNVANLKKESTASESLDKKDEEILSQANALFEAGENLKAKELYLEAAKNGSAEAHFAIAYKYDVTREERIRHFSEAARKGHAEALEFALEELLFRANSLRIANPLKALNLYREAKRANPKLKLHNERSKLQIMKKCAEPKGFEVEEFLRKYNVKDEDGVPPYYDIWELAEEASKGGRFGKPDPELVFNLVMRGGSVPDEFESAVNEVYHNWKNGIVMQFCICDHVVSDVGIGYCSVRGKSCYSK